MSKCVRAKKTVNELGIIKEKTNRALNQSQNHKE